MSSEKGDDAAEGSAEKPFKTLKVANEKAEPGSIITVMPGWYEGGITLKDGTAESPTILREAKPGRSFIGRPVILSGFEKVPGLEYTYVAPWSGRLPTLTEVDTGATLRSVASIMDVEELASGYFVDEAAEKVYVHPSDSAGVSHHLYASTREAGIGVKAGNNTVVDGFAFAGFGDAGVKIADVSKVVVQNGKCYLNGTAITVGGVANDLVVRGNEVWSNKSGYDQASQIFFSGKTERGLVENNIAHTSTMDGIRFYGDKALECMARGNLLYDNSVGFYYKVKEIDKKAGAENNVAFDNPGGSIEGELMKHNTYSSYSEMHAYKVNRDTDLDVSKLGADPQFADATYRDYRLQSDSPARKKAPDGSDLGAFQYDGSVVYVKPDGDDGKAGTSVAEAWKTLGHALKNLKAGQTLYIGGGEWKEPLVVTGLKATAEKPAIIRAYKKAKIQFPSIAVKNCENLKLEDLSAVGGGIQVGDSNNIDFLHCVSRDGKGAGVDIVKSKNVVFDSGALVRDGEGFKADAESSDVALISTILMDNKANVNVPAESAGLYTNFNAFSAGLEENRKKYGQDADSIAIPKEEFAGRANDDFRVRAGQPPAVSGRFARPVGPGGAFVAEKIERKNFERIEVLSTTKTSANITWWTPGRRIGTMAQWGKTTDYTRKLDLADELQGEYETSHTVSMVGLDPDTQYHYRLGYRDHKNKGKEVWTEDMTFRTAKEDPKPRKLYVSLEGKDSNDGLTPATAWQTLHKAAREARAGDTVTIAPGRYMEMLRPLQTGTAPDKRITFRAEKPLTVFLDGGLIKFERDGRSYCVLIQSKAFLTFENLVAQRTQTQGNGGYLSGRGYAGLFGIFGSAGIDIKDCVMDGRDRWMACIWTNYAGEMPGALQSAKGFTVTDSLLLYGWRALGYSAVRPCEIRNSILIRPLTGLITEVGDQSRLILRNNIMTNLMFAKAPIYPLWYYGNRIDANYNYYVWDPENPTRYISKELEGGLKAWQTKTGRDKNSLETDDPSKLLMPLFVKFGFGPTAKEEWKNYPDKTPLTVEEIILPKDSPARKAGENGENIGPRWEKWLQSGK